MQRTEGCVQNVKKNTPIKLKLNCFNFKVKTVVIIITVKCSISKKIRTDFRIHLSKSSPKRT